MAESTPSKKHLGKKATESMEDWDSLDIGECKWTPSGKYFAGALKSGAEGLVLKIWKLHRSDVDEWVLIPIKTHRIDGPQSNRQSSGKCLKRKYSRFIEVSSWDDGENKFAIVFFSLHDCSEHTSFVDALCIWKSEIDKTDSADEIIDLTHLIPSRNTELYGNERQMMISSDGSTLMCSFGSSGRGQPQLVIVKNPLDRSKVRLFNHSLDSQAKIAIMAPDSRLISLCGNEITFLELNARHSASNPVMGSVVLNDEVWGYPHPFRFLRKSDPNSNNLLYVLGNTISCFQIEYSLAGVAAAAESSASYRPPSVVPFFRIEVSRDLTIGWLCEDPHLPVLYALFYALKRSVHHVELHCFDLSHLRPINRSEDSCAQFELDSTHTSCIWSHPSGRLSARHQLEANPRFPVLAVVEWDGPTFKVSLVDATAAYVRLRYIPSLQTLALRQLLSQPALYEAERHSGRLPDTLHQLLSRPINFPSPTALVRLNNL